MYAASLHMVPKLVAGLDIIVLHSIDSRINLPNMLFNLKYSGWWPSLPCTLVVTKVARPVPAADVILRLNTRPFTICGRPHHLPLESNYR